MLIDELKPQVDAQLRTQPARESTGVLGSSLGGLISAYAGVRHADAFGLVGAMSPSTWWDSMVIIDEVATIPNQPMRPLLVYDDSGSSQSADGGDDTNLLAQEYLDIGYVEGVDFHHVVQQGALHSEQYWQQRLPGAARFLFGPRLP